MPQIHALETVSLRDVFPNEAQDFTRWLANHLHLLESKLNLTLQLVKVEATLPEAGRVDILAQQVNTEAIVVIENQLGLSDDSHCLRLMGYAASAEANILVWVAQDFTDYHRSILSWLNESDTIAVYAVAVRAYRVADAIAADFQLVVEPPQSQPGATPTSTRMNTNTFYADFYRPVVAQLRRSDMFPVGRGGFRGRWRSFQTGYPEIFYVAGLSEGKALAHLSVYGADNQHIYHALTQHRADIDARLNNGAEWEEGKDYSRIGLRTEAVIGDPKPDLETVGDWIAENLVRLRDVVQPYLDEMMNDAATSGDNEDAEWS